MPGIDVNGVELRRFIVARIDRELANHPDYQENIRHHEPEFDFRVELKSYRYYSLQQSADTASEPACEPVPDRRELTEQENRLLGVLRRGPSAGMLRRVVQKRVWRLKAPAFQQAIEGLCARGLIRQDGAWLRSIPSVSEKESSLYSPRPLPANAPVIPAR
jgi:hypothetical protein